METHSHALEASVISCPVSHMQEKLFHLSKVGFVLFLVASPPPACAGWGMLVCQAELLKAPGSWSKVCLSLILEVKQLDFTTLLVIQ